MTSTVTGRAGPAARLPEASVFMQAMNGLLRLLGRYPVLLLLALASTATLAYWLPQQIQAATLGGARGGAKLLDEHLLTWTARDADLLFSGLGASGRQAYRNFYVTFDFYFPALLSSLTLISLLAICLRQSPRARHAAWLPVVPYLFGVAENLNHLTMLGAWPDHPAFCWTVGPWFTAGKWVSLFGTLGVVALAAAMALLEARTRSSRPGTT